MNEVVIVMSLVERGDDDTPYVGSRVWRFDLEPSVTTEDLEEFLNKFKGFIEGGRMANL